MYDDTSTRNSVKLDKIIEMMAQPNEITPAGIEQFGKAAAEAMVAAVKRIEEGTGKEVGYLFIDFPSGSSLQVHFERPTITS